MRTAPGEGFVLFVCVFFFFSVVRKAESGLKRLAEYKATCGVSVAVK